MRLSSTGGNSNAFLAGTVGISFHSFGCSPFSKSRSESSLAKSLSFAFSSPSQAKLLFHILNPSPSIPILSSSLLATAFPPPTVTKKFAGDPSLTNPL